MKKIKKYPLLKYLPLVILFPIALNFILFSFDSGLSYGDGNVWLAFWGNYTGGLISALVAYFVANSQIERQISRDSDQRQFELAINQLPALIRSRIELEKVILELERVKEENDSHTNIWRTTNDYEELEDVYKTPRSQRSYSILKKMFFHVELINKEVLKYLDKVEDIDLQIKLINAFSFYEEFSGGLNFDFYMADIKFDDLYMQRLNDDNGRNLTAEGHFFNLETEMIKALNERRKGFMALYDENKIEEFKETLSLLNDEIDYSNDIKLRGTAKG